MGDDKNSKRILALANGLAAAAFFTPIIEPTPTVAGMVGIAIAFTVITMLFLGGE